MSVHVELHLGDLRPHGFVPWAYHAVYAKVGRATAKKSIPALLASFGIAGFFRARKAEITIPLIMQSLDHGSAVPFFCAALGADHVPSCAVLFVVILPCCEFKIFETVIRFVAIDVMNNFVWTQFALQRLFHYYPMLISAVVCSPFLGRQDNIAVTDGFAIPEVWIVFTNGNGVSANPSGVALDKANGFAFYMASVCARILCNGGLLSTAAVAIAVGNIVRGNMGLHKNLLILVPSPRTLARRWDNFIGCFYSFILAHLSQICESPDAIQEGASYG